MLTSVIQDSTTVYAYIPQDVWYDFVSGVEVTAVGQFVDLDAPLEKINLHVRGGFIIPMHTPGAILILGRGNPFQLLVALSSSGNASGNLYWDDGDSIGMLSVDVYYLVDIRSYTLLLDHLDPIGTNAYNYLEFTLTSVVSQYYSVSLFIALFLHIGVEYSDNECSYWQLQRLAYVVGRSNSVGTELNCHQCQCEWSSVYEVFDTTVENDVCI